MAWKPAYASLTEMRDWLRLRDAEDTDDDGLLRLKLSAASRAVDRACHRQFGKVDTAVTRSYDVRWSRTRQCYVAEIEDLMDTTGLSVELDDQALTADQYALRPRNAIADGEPYTWVEVRNVAVSLSPGFWLASGLPRSPRPPVLDMLGLWGWNAPWPDPIKESTMLQASRLNIRRDSPYGIAGGADGGELRLLARLDPDIEPLVGDYVRTGWVAR
jgi:hypothetical protein